MLALIVAVLVPGLPIEHQPYTDRPVLTGREEHALLLEMAREVETARAEPQDVPAEEIPSPEGDAPPPDVPADPDGTQRVAEPWQSLADCESGDWIDGGRAFVDGSARWDWAKPGTDVPSWGTTIHHGGLQHHPDTWRWVAGDLGLLDRYPHAYDAPPDVQVQVATEVQRRQGWEAWPVCSRLVGLR